MKLYRYTSLGRPVDLAFPTNRAIVLNSGLVVLGVGVTELLAHTRPAQATVTALATALAVFLAWALGRELDPDRDGAAFAAAALALLASWTLGTPSILALLVVLLSLRIVNRTVGPPARALDSLALFALALLVVARGGWVPGAVAGTAFLLDGVLKPPHRRHFALAVGVAAFLAWQRALPPAASAAGAGGTLRWAAIGLALPFLGVVVRGGSPVSVTDIGSQPLLSSRVRAAQVLGLVAVLLGVAGEATGLRSLAPLWAAVAGAGLHWLAVGRGQRRAEA